MSAELRNDVRAKRDRLLALLESLGSCAVAFSGGLDSGVLAAAAQKALGERAAAVTGASPSISKTELDAAGRLAARIGIRHEVVATSELDDPAYRANTAQRCYHCRREVLARIKQVARRLGLEVVTDGVNRDDARDHRPGRRAAEEASVRSPLAECDLSKEELRQLAAHWDLPVRDKPSSPCLRSRIAYGEPITPARLAMVDRAEAYLRQCGFTQLRVRYHHGDVARIEVPSGELCRFLDADLQAEVVARLKSLGFTFVTLDLEGFRSGSLNAMLRPDELEPGCPE